MNEYLYDDIYVGQEETFNVKITQKLMDNFFKLTGDCNPLHRDLDYAKSVGFDKNVVYGMLTASFLSTLAGVYLPGKYSLIHTIETDFVKPVFVGDTLTVKGIVKEKNDDFKVFWLKVDVFNQNGQKVVRGKMRIGCMC